MTISSFLMPLIPTEISLLLLFTFLPAKFLPLRNLNTCFLFLEALFQIVSFLGDNDTTQGNSAWLSYPWCRVRRLVPQDFLKLLENRVSQIPEVYLLEAEHAWAAAA